MVLGSINWRLSLNRDPFISFLQYLISRSNNGSLKISCRHLVHCFAEEKARFLVQYGGLWKSLALLWIISLIGDFPVKLKAEIESCNYSFLVVWLLNCSRDFWNFRLIDWNRKAKTRSKNQKTRKIIFLHSKSSQTLNNSPSIILILSISFSTKPHFSL